MTTLVSAQLEFQKYNERLGGPSTIPLGEISIATLQKDKEMSRGLRYDNNKTGYEPVDIDWGSDTETFPDELIEEEERQLQILKEKNREEEQFTIVDEVLETECIGDDVYVTGVKEVIPVANVIHTKHDTEVIPIKPSTSAPKKNKRKLHLR